MKLLAPTLEAAQLARRARPAIDTQRPQPVDDNGDTPLLWSDCTAWVIDDAPDVTTDDQDLVVAIAASPGKIKAADNTPAKIKAKLTGELAKAKTDREGGKKPGRVKTPKTPKKAARGG